MFFVCLFVCFSADISPFGITGIPVFGLLLTSVPDFKSRVDPVLVCFIA